MKAVSHKGHLGCIEILKAKAAIMFDRFCMDKARQEVESQEEEEEEREKATMKEEVTVDYCLCYFTVRLMEGRKCAQTDRQSLVQVKVFYIKRTLI